MRCMIRYSRLFEGLSRTVMFFTEMQQRVDIVHHQVLFGLAVLNNGTLIFCLA
jgi:hypothetical protein